MQIFKLECPNCHAALDLDLEHLQAYCPYCGSKLLIDMDQLGNIIAEQEKTKRLEIEKTTELKKAKYESILNFLKSDMVIAAILIVFLSLLALIIGLKIDY